MRFLITALLLLPLAAFAEPGTYTIVGPTFSHDGTGGTPDGYRVYEGCDLALQTVGSLLADPAVPGQDISFAGDSTNPAVVCAIPFNSSGPGTGFTNVLTYTASVEVPGKATIVSGNCSFTATSGEVYNCNVTPSP